MKKLHGSILSCLVLCSGIFFLSAEVEPKTDTLWLHYTGYEVFEPEHVRENIRDLQCKTAYDCLEIQRREVMRWNYPVHVAAARVGAVLFPENQQAAVSVGMAVPFLLGIFVFLFGAARSGAVGPLAVSASVFALTALLPGPIPTDHLLLHGPVTNLFNLTALLANPGGAFSPLSVQPKSTVLLIVLAALALRRTGLARLGYALVVVSAAWHVSFSAVVLVMFVAVDAIKRRALQRVVSDEALAAALCVLGAVGCALIYVAVRSNMAWGVESAFIQLSARLLVLAEVLCVGWAGFAAWAWLGDALGVRRERFISGVCGFVALLSAYAAAGTLWEHGRYYAARFADPAVAASYGSVAAYYDEALRRLMPPR